jgi:hypothetical protein
MIRHVIPGSGPLALAADLARTDALGDALGAGRGAIVNQCAALPYLQWSEFPALQRAILTEAGRAGARMSEESLDAHRRGEVAVAISRACDYFGQRVVNSALGDRAIGKVVRGGFADVFGEPGQPHSWTYIRDAARTISPDRPQLAVT